MGVYLLDERESLLEWTKCENEEDVPVLRGGRSRRPIPSFESDESTIGKRCVVWAYGMGLRPAAYGTGLWPMAYGLWPMAYGPCPMAWVYGYFGPM